MQNERIFIFITKIILSIIEIHNVTNTHNIIWFYRKFRANKYIFKPSAQWILELKKTNLI